MENSPLRKSFLTFFEDHNLLHPKQHFLVAVSGGIDSVVLAHLCQQAQFSFSMVHCNFGLRGEESNRDEAFVKTLGDQYGVHVFVTHFETKKFAEEKKISIQEAARMLRYQWFAQIREQQHAAFTLLAHHVNDDIETLLMNFFRGSGLEGLSGMDWKVVHNFCLRPLLKITRKEIEDYARENGLQWVEDSSNNSNKYTRNFFRNELIPAIQKVYPQVEENLLDTIDRLRKTDNLYSQLVTDLKTKLKKTKGEEVRYVARQLMSYQHTSLIYEIIKEYGFGEKQVPEVLKLCHSESGKFIENDSYQIIKHRAWLVIAPKAAMASTVAIKRGEKEVRFGGGFLEIRQIKKEKWSLKKAAETAQLDVSKIEFPLLLRPWLQGDYFYPLGMPKKKKLSRFFIDQKLAKNEKESVWVLESAGRIIWLVGYRIDDRVKVTETTKEVLEIIKTNPLTAYKP